ncbi:flippase-like domain-containing protein [bacterium]|nr:MAG: flippase-like domain-containing protein [bacterium]
MKRFVFPLLCALFLLFVWFNRAQADSFWHVLKGASLLPLLVAVSLQVGTLLNQPALFQSLYTLVGIEVKWRELLPVVLAGRFINVVAPAAGLGETALLFEQAKRRGWQASRVAVVTTLYFALNFAVFALILVAGFAFLAARGDLKSFELVAAVPLLLGLCAGIFILFWIARRPEAFAQRAQQLTQKLPRRIRDRFDVLASPDEAVMNFSASLRSLPTTRAGWVRPIIHALLVDLLEIAVLGACMAAFKVPVSPALLLAGYAVGTLFTIVSISPQGLGAVEGALGATLVSLGLPLTQATAIVLLYRGLSFWLPLLVGLAATRVWAKNLALSSPPAVAPQMPLPNQNSR